MSERLGPFVILSNENVSTKTNILDQQSGNLNLSDNTAQIIDEEIRLIIDKAYKNAALIINNNVDKLHIMAMSLLKYETINSDQINNIMDNT
jgi:cell division protease FtsH